MAGTPNSVSGVRNVLDVNQARRVVDMAPTIIMLEDDKSALTTLLTKLGVRKVKNHRFDWMVDEIVPKTHTVGAGGLLAVGARAAAVTAGDANIDLSGRATTPYLRRGDIIRVHATGEQMEVAADVTTMASVDVFEDIDGAIAASPADGSAAAGVPVTRVSSAHPEVSTLRLPTVGATPATSSDVFNSLSTLAGDSAGGTGTASGGINPNFGEADWNYTQIMRDPVTVSERAQEAELHGGKELAHQRMKKLLEHAEKCENAIWHQARVDNAPSAAGDPNNAATLTGGLIWFIENLAQSPGSQTFNVSGNLTEDILNAFLRTFGRYGNSKKAFFASEFVCSVISRYLREGTNYRAQVGTGESETAGGRVVSYVGGNGMKIDIIPTTALEGIPGDLPSGGGFGGSVPSTWDGYGVLVDMENVKLAKYGDNYMKLRTDRQLPDQTATVDEYFSDIGLQAGNINHHGLLSNIQGAGI